MKRKLNESDVPMPAQDTQVAKTANSFEAFNLDSRLLQAIAKQNFASPTEVQSKAIPLALSGKDILVRSRTGSGKSAAYILPILHSILKAKSGNPKEKCTSALILVPTKELAQQITKAVDALAAFCSQDVRVVNLTQKVAESVQRSLLVEQPDIVVSTPSRIPQNLASGALNAETIRHLVVDEADLVLSYGYEKDFQIIARSIPKGIQTSLISATLSTDIDTLKDLFCRDPAIIDVKEKADETGGVSQYVVRCAEEEKFLLIYVVYKLKLIKGKSIIFVADIDRCYRLKLFLEQFGISSCVLNSELPVNSRIHVVEEFNKNVYDIIIASDEHEVLGDEESTRRLKKPRIEEAEEGKEAEGAGDVQNEKNETPEKPIDDTTTTNPKKRPKNRKSKRDKEYGISRGIDFQNVSLVLNFDLPPSPQSYTHRIGRTARAGKTGMALSFAIPSALYKKHPPTSHPSTAHDSLTLDAITFDQASRNQELKPYHFDMKQVNAFKYRMNDALRAVTGQAVLEARKREIRQEVLNSERLKRWFEENPQDLRVLKRHDSEAGTARVQRHLRFVPEYLMPKGGAKGIVKDDNVGFVGFRKQGGSNRVRKAMAGKGRKGGRGAGGKGKGRDPLKGFGRK